jgi:tripartite ATP-independent transporter DctM subunit
MTAYLIIPFIFLLLAFILKMPLGYGMLAGSVAYFLFKEGMSIANLLNTVCYGMFSTYILMAIPLFIFTANVMNSSEITDKIFNFAKAIVGRFRGGLAYVNILASLLFAGMTGSALADAAGLGILEIEQMDKDGYDRPFSCAITAASAVIGPTFPPSIPLVVYAMISGASVGKLFLGGMIPSLFLCLGLAIYVAYISRKRNYPRGLRMTLKEALLYTLKALPALLTPVLLLGGIYTGVMTPTEAAAVAGLYALLIAFVVYRTLSLKALGKIIVSTIKTTGSIFLVVMGAYGFNYIVSVEQVGTSILNLLSGFTGSPVVFLIIMNIVFLILGCLVDVNISILVVLPVLMPLVEFFNIDPIHFGVVVCLNLMIGLLTPPFGMLLFVTSGIGKCPLKDLIRETMPMVAMELIVLAIITFIPETVLFATRLIS